MHVPARQAELLQVGTHGLGRDALLAQLGDRARAVALRELRPVGAEDEPVVDVLGGSPPSARDSAACRSAFARWSLPRMTCVMPRSRSSTTLASWYVARPSARSRVGRRSSRKRIAPSSSYACSSSSRRSAAALIQLGPLALANRPFFPTNAEPLEVGDDPSPPRIGARGVGVVDAQDQHAALLVRERSVGDGGQRASEMQRAGRAGRETNADHANRT